MIKVIDSLSIEGWGYLLKALLPTNWGLALVDFLFFIVFPFLVLVLLVMFFRKHANAGASGAWRSAGTAWSKCFWLSMVAMIVAYFGAKDVLTTNLSGTVSFRDAYVQSLPGYVKGSSEADNLKNITEQLRNRKTDVKVRDLMERHEFKIVKFVCWRFGYIHPFFLTIIDMILLGIFFWPGFKMKKQGIKL